MAKKREDTKRKKSNIVKNKIEKKGDDVMEKNEKEVLNNVEENKEKTKETVIPENSTDSKEPNSKEPETGVISSQPYEPKTVAINPPPYEPETEIINSASNLKEEKFSDKLANGIEGAAKITAKAVATGYNKAETFVKSEEFKQGVEKTKNTTKAVAAGIFRGLKKLGQEVSTAVKEVKNREEPIVDPNQDKTKNI